MLSSQDVKRAIHHLEINKLIDPVEVRLPASASHYSLLYFRQAVMISIQVQDVVISRVRCHGITSVCGEHLQPGQKGSLTQEMISQNRRMNLARYACMV